MLPCYQYWERREKPTFSLACLQERARRVLLGAFAYCLVPVSHYGRINTIYRRCGDNNIMHVRLSRLAEHPHPCSSRASSTAVSGALIAGTYALAKRRGQAVASIYAASAGLNCGITGATFLSTSPHRVLSPPCDPFSLSSSHFVGIRGYVVMPLLDQVLPSRQHGQENVRRAPASSEVSGDGAVTWGAMRLHRTLDAALSGGITGGVLNTWRRSSLLLPSPPGQIRLNSKTALPFS